MDSQRIQVYLHHGGNFDEGGDGGRLRYKWGKVDVWPECDEDCLDVFWFWNRSNELGYTNLSNVYWLDSSKRFRDGLRQLKKDGDLLEAIKVAKQNGGELHVYYEHPFQEPELVDISTILKEVLDSVKDDGQKGDKTRVKEGVAAGGDEGTCKGDVDGSTEQQGSPTIFQEGVDVGGDEGICKCDVGGSAEQRGNPTIVQEGVDVEGDEGTSEGVAGGCSRQNACAIDIGAVVVDEGRCGLRVKSPARRFQESVKSPGKSPIGGGSESGGSKRVLRFKSPTKKGPGLRFTESTFGHH